MSGFSTMVERRRFRALLGLAVAAMLVQPLGDGSVVWAHVALLLYAGVFAGTAALARPLSRLTPFALGLVALWLLLAILDANGLDASAVRTAAFVSSVALVAFSALFAFEALAYDTTEGSDALAGAVFGYLLLAQAWAVVYRAIEIMEPGSFSLSEGADASTELLYFSLVTITTLGYGDVLPVAPFSRVLAGVEAAVGTLYIAVLIGRIVGALSPSPRRSGGNDER